MLHPNWSKHCWAAAAETSAYAVKLAPAMSACVEGLDLDDPATAVEGFGSPEVDECPLVAPQAPEPAGWG